MYIEALNKDFPLAYTVEAQSKMAEKAGRLEDLQTLFDGEAADVTENTLWVLSVMMEAAVHREKVRCRIFGDEYTGGEAPSYEDLRTLLTPIEMAQNAMEEITSAMSVGQKTTVEVKEEKGKNVKATQ